MDRAKEDALVRNGLRKEELKEIEKSVTAVHECKPPLMVRLLNVPLPGEVERRV